VNDNLPLFRIPMIQTIATTALVSPSLMMISRPTELFSRVPANLFLEICTPMNDVLCQQGSFDSEIELFDDVLMLVGDVPSFIEVYSDEINSFRHAAARFRCASSLTSICIFYCESDSLWISIAQTESKALAPTSESSLDDKDRGKIQLPEYYFSLRFIVLGFCSQLAI